MTQPKSKSSKSKSKKTTTAATSKKVVKRVSAAKPVGLETVATPRPIFTAPVATAPVATAPVATARVATAPVATARVATAPVSTPALAPVRLVTRAEFMDLVRKEAYRRYAARRAFKQGSPFQDWVNAEAAVSGKLAAEGARLS